MNFSEPGDCFELSIDENTNCIVSGNQCITESATAYVINDDGTIIVVTEITEGSGSFGVLSLLLLLMFSLRVSTRKQLLGLIETPSLLANIK